MHIISQKKIRESAIKYPDSAGALLAWLKLMRSNNPTHFSEMKSLVNSVDKVMNYHIFNISGNKLRLVAVVNYRYHKIFIKEILTHSEYDKRRFS